MKHAVLLTSSIDPDALAAAVDRATNWLSKSAAECEVHDLAPGQAWEVILNPTRATDLFERCKADFAHIPVDVNCVPAGPDRRATLLVADMDSTIIQQECIDEIADFVGKKAEVSDITERAMRGELEFESALRARVALLKGLAEATLQEIADTRIILTPGARTLVQTMNAHGAETALISGGFTFFTAHVAGLTGFKTNQANTLLAENGHLTGEVAEPILGAQAKLAALLRLSKQQATPRSLAVGDGANDLAMIEAADLGVAFRAKPIVAERASAQLNHSDLTALLYLQGYTRAELVT